jgi:transcriptional regulator GlxA family with amidase domain
MTRPTDGKQIIPVYVIVPPRLLLLDVAGPLEVLRKANLDQDKVEFAVHYVGPLGTVHSSIGLAVTGVDPLPDAVPHGSLVIVSGSTDVPLGGPVASRDEDAVFEHEIISWLKRVVCPGVRLVTICSGALLAARAGLLDGYVCTTHHLAIAELEKSAPTAKVLQNRLFVEDGERLTAGIDLMLQIVADIIGHGVALSVARYLVVYLRRSGGDPQLSPWLEGRNHMNPVVHRAQDAIAADPAGAWPVEKLADVSGASPRNLSRLFNEHAGMSVTDYVNRLKVGLAREMLLNSGLDIENVAERSGFASARQFRRAWQRIYDQPPSHARGAVG